MARLDPVLEYAESDFGNAVSRYLAFLRIPSISTDPAYKDEVRRAGKYLEDEFRSLGFEATLHETAGHPILLAHHEGEAPGAPHLLYYGHYDVQPPEPLELWDSPPFEPAIVDGPHGKRVVARGAVDDKGQVMTFLEAFRAWKAVHGALPASVTVLLEGEEECGSVSLPGFLEKHATALREASIAIITDTNAWDIDTPAITYRLRGNVYMEVTLSGPSRDLHSGLYGGAVVNPLNALTEILGQLHGRDGRVQVPGFYDDVEDLSAGERKAWSALNFDEGELPRRGWPYPIHWGSALLAPGASLGAADMRSARHLGWLHGTRSKTVIANHASAKLSFRTVPNQKPAKIMKGLKQFLDARTPPDCKWRVEQFGGSEGILVPADGPYMQAARAGLKDIFKKAAAMVGCGGSIPVVGDLQKQLGLDFDPGRVRPIRRPHP